jgi:hypothetical protein
MFNLIISLGVTTYVLLITTIIFITVGRMKRVKRKRIFFKLHQIFAITTAVLATVHGTLAALYFYGVI